MYNERLHEAITKTIFNNSCGSVSFKNICLLRVSQFLTPTVASISSTRSLRRIGSSTRGALS